MNHLAKQISLVIPTFNRPEFIKKLLYYYADLGFQGEFLIGDSSGEAKLALTKKVAESLKDRLSIRIYPCPNMNEPKTTSKLVSLVETPYVAWLADDDYLVPKGLYKCADFLEKNSDYSVAHGLTVMIILKGDPGSNILSHVGCYDVVRDVLEESGSERVMNFLPNYFPLTFGIHRTQDMKEACRLMGEFGDPNVAELFIAGIFAIQGKIKKLDCFYLVRQLHGGRYTQTDFYEWLMGEKWSASYQIGFKLTSEKLASQDSIPIEEARSIVKKAVWKYLAQNVALDWKFHYDKKYSIKDQLKKNPVVHKSLKKMKEVFLRDPFSLPFLTRSSSPFYSDFKPIFESIQDKFR